MTRQKQGKDTRRQAGSAQGGSPGAMQSGNAQGSGNGEGYSGSEGGDRARQAGDVGNMARSDLSNRQWDEVGEEAGDTVQTGGKKGVKGDAATSGEHARNKQGRSSS